jgi:hypothetical protein
MDGALYDDLKAAFPEQDIDHVLHEEGGSLTTFWEEVVCEKVETVGDLTWPLLPRLLSYMVGFEVQHPALWEFVIMAPAGDATRHYLALLQCQTLLQQFTTMPWNVTLDFRSLKFSLIQSGQSTSTVDSHDITNVF